MNVPRPLVRRRGLDAVTTALALLLAAVGVGRLSAQTVRVADLEPRSFEVQTGPSQPLQLSVNMAALQRYGGIARVRFRIVREVLVEGQTGSACMSIPTRILTPRINATTGQLDFGQPFTVFDLDVKRGRLAEASYYLVAELAGAPGENLFLRPEDLKRYTVRAVVVVVEPHTDTPPLSLLKKIEADPGDQAKPGGTGQCWTVS